MTEICSSRSSLLTGMHKIHQTTVIGYMKLSLGLKKLVWSWMLQRGSRGSCNQSYILPKCPGSLVLLSQKHFICPYYAWSWISESPRNPSHQRHTMSTQKLIHVSFHLKGKRCMIQRKSVSTQMWCLVSEESWVTLAPWDMSLLHDSNYRRNTLPFWMVMFHGKTTIVWSDRYYASNDPAKEISCDKLFDCIEKEPIRSKLVYMTSLLILCPVWHISIKLRWTL